MGRSRVSLTLNPGYAENRIPPEERTPCPHSPASKARAVATPPARASPTRPFAVEKLTPIIGAEITGVDLGRLVSDERQA